ncbi:ATP-grasp domain-containing protein [Empedobacter brevis]|uniref:ATP-grasp domain-containing protein n=1 Tax=Empedobacter brevis TaxID=247 RepID=UPI0039AFB7A9
MEFKVLVTAIGSFSAQAVVDSLKRNEVVKAIYGCDIFPAQWHHVSKEFDDVFLAPYVFNEKEYFDFINRIIKSKELDIIIPLTDIEVDFFNKYRSDFSNILVCIADDNFLGFARNKFKLTKFLEMNNFNFPKSYSIDFIKEANYPLIAKPKNGRSSEGVFYLNSIDDLNKDYDYSNYIFQQFIEGTICTIDVLRNKFSDEIAIISRKELLRTKNGAGMTVEMFYDEYLISEVIKISQLLDGHGVYNMEFIKRGNQYYLIDVNPRFSAGIGFTILTGYDIVKNMVNVFMEKPIDKVLGYKNMILQKHMVEVINEVL